MKYPVELIEGVPLLVHGARRILLDTGAPVMVGRGPGFTFLGRSYALERDFCGATAERLSEYLGAPMDVLAGVPLFLDHAVRFDWSTGTVGFADRPGTGWGERRNDPVVLVSFDPEGEPGERVTLRYEYRPALVALGVLPRHAPTRDRLLERDRADAGFAQPPAW